jgi:hypothetical protein
MSRFASVAEDVAKQVKLHLSAADRDADWQRVNSYVADILKDAHVLYAKLARLQGDFAGGELDELEKISEGVLAIGGKLARFSKAFYEGSAELQEKGVYGEEKKTFGGSPSGGASGPAVDEFDFSSLEDKPAAPTPAVPAPAPAAPPALEFDFGKSSDEAASGESAPEIDLDFDFTDLGGSDEGESGGSEEEKSGKSKKK